MQKKNTLVTKMMPFILLMQQTVKSEASLSKGLRQSSLRDVPNFNAGIITG